MLTLGIETSCDETAISIVADGKSILSNIIYSQSAFHARFGGVVPELASRQHIDVIKEVLNEALSQANVSLEEIDLIAVANGPGLIGSLLVGLNFAKGLAFSLKKPLIGVNHVEAHLFASFIGKEPPPLPAIGVVISGGHTALLYIKKWGEYELLGETQDDAIGEAFDKVASLLNLPYPGGPKIEKLALSGDPKRFSLSAGKVKNRELDFSFSGLKTGVLYLIKGQNAAQENTLSESDNKDIAASFQEVALKDIVAKTKLALKKRGAESLLFGGGVSANGRLRELFNEAGLSQPLYWPEKKFSVDNGAMIAVLGFFNYTFKGQSGDLYDLEAFSRFDWSTFGAQRMSKTE